MDRADEGDSSEAQERSHSVHKKLKLFIASRQLPSTRVDIFQRKPLICESDERKGEQRGGRGLKCESLLLVNAD